MGVCLRQCICQCVCHMSVISHLGAYLFLVVDHFFQVWLGGEGRLCDKRGHDISHRDACHGVEALLVEVKPEVPGGGVCVC
jgi:hypothetical protein